MTKITKNKYFSLILIEVDGAQAFPFRICIFSGNVFNVLSEWTRRLTISRKTSDLWSYGCFCMCPAPRFAVWGQLALGEEYFDKQLS